MGKHTTVRAAHDSQPMIALHAYTFHQGWRHSSEGHRFRPPSRQTFLVQLQTAVSHLNQTLGTTGSGIQFLERNF